MKLFLLDSAVIDVQVVTTVMAEMKKLATFFPMDFLDPVGLVLLLLNYLMNEPVRLVAETFVIAVNFDSSCVEIEVVSFFYLELQ